MNKADIEREAQQILDGEVGRLRRVPYNELLRYLEPHAFEVAAPSGRVFQVEVTALWDDRKQGHLRVITATDDSKGWGLRDYKSDDFIITPDGRFIGEGAQET
ncbi:MAG: hypothetical protein ACRDT4_18685 [Micromonosporaceae bacterium]